MCVYFYGLFIFLSPHATIVGSDDICRFPFKGNELVSLSFNDKMTVGGGSGRYEYVPFDQVMASIICRWGLPVCSDMVFTGSHLFHVRGVEEVVEVDRSGVWLVACGWHFLETACFVFVGTVL